MRWITGLRQAREAAGKLPEVQCVCIADSEADIYELFAEPRAVAGGREVEWLVRACRNRALETPGKDGRRHLRDKVSATPALYEAELFVRGRQAKTQMDKRVRRQPRQSRQIKVEVRAATMTLRPPRRADRQLPPITVNVVLVSEINPPGGGAGGGVGPGDNPAHRQPRPGAAGGGILLRALGY